MEAYTDFAEVYDIFMDETPYQEWADFLAGLMEKYGPSRRKDRERRKDGEHREDGECRESGEGREDEERAQETLSSERDLVLELGCGTGTLTELLSEKGYDMIGVDLSPEMLDVAVKKKERSGSSILYLCQDMRELDLYSTVGTIVSVCDSVNYLLEDEEVVKTFSLVNNYLYPGGIFIFDFNTVYKYEQVIGDATIAENREECSFIWENYYDPAQHINEYDLTVFVREAEEGLFRRFSETHFQRGYTAEEMRAFVERAGMKVELLLDADSHKAPTGSSERIYVVAREYQKQTDCA